MRSRMIEASMQKLAINQRSSRFQVIALLMSFALIMQVGFVLLSITSASSYASFDSAILILAACATILAFITQEEA